MGANPASVDGGGSSKCSFIYKALGYSGFIRERVKSRKYFAKVNGDSSPPAKGTVKVKFEFGV